MNVVSLCGSFHLNHLDEVDAKHVIFQMCDALPVRAFQFCYPIRFSTSIQKVSLIAIPEVHHFTSEHKCLIDTNCEHSCYQRQPSNCQGS